jgi:Peptidase_C39 like family
MRSRLWTASLIALATLCAPGGWLATVSSAQAGIAGAPAGAAARSPSMPSFIRAAAQAPAPLVPDSGGVRSKKGLAEPLMSADMTSANLRKQQQARSFLQVVRSMAGPDGKCISRACRRVLPIAKDVAATQQAQVRNYFCGPATISEMLAQVGKNVSQRTAARELRTTTSGTDWSNSHGYPMPNVLNRNQRINDYVAVALPWSPTGSQTRTYEIDLVTDINHGGGVPLAGNAYEVAGGPHLAGHPTGQTIFHWFDIRGYAASGGVTDYQDSVHGASSIGWSGAVPAYSALASSTIVSILGARGYDW